MHLDAYFTEARIEKKKFHHRIFMKGRESTVSYHSLEPNEIFTSKYRLLQEENQVLPRSKIKSQT